MSGGWKDRLKKLAAADRKARTTEIRRMTLDRAARVLEGLLSNPPTRSLLAPGAEAPREAFTACHETVESGRFDYLFSGDLAAALWGDLVLFLPDRHAYKFLRTAAGHGFFVEEDLAIQQIQVSGWARLPFGDRKSPGHLDLTLGDSPFDRSALARKKRVVLFERKVWVAAPEDLLVYKLVSWRDRDVMDVHAVVRRQKKSLDAAYLRKWVLWWEKEGIEGIRARFEALGIGA